MLGKYESQVYLEPIEHVYIHKKSGKKFTSVTKVISLIEEEFNSDAIASAIVNQSNADKQERYIGMSVDQILELWQNINDEANEFGTRVHALIEKYLNRNRYFFGDDEFEKNIISKFLDVDFDFSGTYYPERILFSEEYELSGTADLIMDVDDDMFDLGDWKTNKVYEFYSKYKKWLLPPFEHLQDCQHNVYSLQLSTYALMYEMETGRKCRQIWIGHYSREYNIWTKVPVVYLKYEATKLLKLHKFRNQLSN